MVRPSILADDESSNETREAEEIHSSDTPKHAIAELLPYIGEQIRHIAVSSCRASALLHTATRCGNRMCNLHARVAKEQLLLSEQRGLLFDRTSTITASMLPDMQAGNPIEADHVLGDMILRAKRPEIEVPLLTIAYTHFQI